MKHALMLFACLVAQACQCQAKEWVVLPLGPNQDLVLETSGDRTARIPLRYADGVSAPASGVQARLFAVSSKDGHGKTLADQFTLKVSPAAAEKDMAVEVTVAKDATEVLPGPYALTVRVGPDTNDIKESQLLGVTLTSPAPQVSVEPVVVGKVLAFAGLGDDTVNKGELRLTEKGGKASLSSFNLSYVRDAPTTGQPDNGALSFERGASAVQAGNAASVPVSVQGDFPLGKTSGKVELRSRDLAAPLTTTFEVRIRRSGWWIVLMVVLGSIAGFLSRKYLVDRKAKLEALAAASQTLALYRREFAGTADATYRRELRKLDDEFQSGIGTMDAAKIKDATTKLQDGLVAARGRFEQRLQPLSQAAIALHRLIDRAWEGPPAVVDALARLEGLGSELSTLLAHRDVDSASELTARKIGPALSLGLAAVADAGANLTRLGQKVLAGAPPLLADDLKNLADASEACAKKFPWPSPDPTDATTDTLSSALSDWTAMGSVLRKMLAAVPQLSHSFVAWAVSRLDPANADVALAALAKQTDVSLQDIPLSAEAMSDHPKFGEVEDKLSALRSDWLKYLESKAPAAQAELSDAVAASKWSTAVELVKKAMLPAATAMQRVAPTAATATEDLPRGQGLPGPSMVPAELGGALGFEPASLLLGTASERASLLGAAERASWLQTLILGGVFLWGTFVLYDEAWVGTGKEMLTLFMIAFSLDMTADNVLAAFKKMKLPEA